MWYTWAHISAHISSTVLHCPPMSTKFSELPTTMLVILDTPGADLQVAMSQSRHPTSVDPATSWQRGSITWDQEHGIDLEWESLEDFHKWCESEQRAHGIELRICHMRKPQASTRGTVFTGSKLFVCTCQGTGGMKKYERKLTMKARGPNGLMVAVPAACWSKSILIPGPFLGSTPPITLT